ncbi:MAG: helix-turn-helix domain-containing protein [Lachnospiraceae bacterium]|nr:helix-turn-helix domain-containing protein [Lachnospiraceae bacterium]
MPKKNPKLDENFGKDGHIWGRPVDSPAEYEKNVAIGKTIKALRKRRGEDQDIFGSSFSRYIGRAKPFKRSTISGWEKGILPSKKTLRQLCDFLGVTYETLGCGENDEFKKFDTSEIDKMFSELRKYYHMPVWCELDKKKHIGAWAIVDATKNELIFSATKHIPFERINFNVYAQQTPFSVPAESSLSPLSRYDIYDSVWIEPIGDTYLSRHMSMEWAQKYEQLEAYISASGIIYPFDENGITYLCYRDLC